MRYCTTAGDSVMKVSDFAWDDSIRTVLMVEKYPPSDVTRKSEVISRVMCTWYFENVFLNDYAHVFILRSIPYPISLFRKYLL